MKEFKVISLRENVGPQTFANNKQDLINYWNSFIKLNSIYDEQKEMCVVVLLNTRLKIIGHNIISLGGLDYACIHAREVFRPAIVAAAHSVILMHNHPSGDPTPSELDIRATREIARGGNLLKINLLDHVIVAGETGCSLKELGFFV